MAIKYFSDPHFGHEEIISHCKRPFVSVDEMNDIIIENINSKTRADDMLILMGDIFPFSGYGFEKKKGIIKSLNGHKVLIMGNHDFHHSIAEWQELGFKEVYRYPIIRQERIIVSHKIQFLNPKSFFVNAHGHTHQLSTDSKLHLNLSCEKTNYGVVDEREVLKYFAKRKNLRIGEFPKPYYEGDAYINNEL